MNTQINMAYKRRQSGEKSPKSWFINFLHAASGFSLSFGLEHSCFLIAMPDHRHLLVPSAGPFPRFYNLGYPQDRS